MWSFRRIMWRPWILSVLVEGVGTLRIEDIMQSHWWEDPLPLSHSTPGSLDWVQNEWGNNQYGKVQGMGMMLMEGTSGLLKSPHLFGQEGVHRIEDSVPQRELWQRETSVKDCSESFPLQKLSQRHSGWDVLMSNSQPNSRHMKKMLPTHCQLAMCVEFLLQMRQGALIIHLDSGSQFLIPRPSSFLVF